MENIYYVYEWIRLDTNEPFYVGKGMGGRYLEKRRNNWTLNVINKIGWENVAACIIEDNLNEDESFEKEIYYISLYKEEFGFNLTNISQGGEGPSGARWKLSEETKKKMSERSWIKGKGYLISGSKSYWYGKKLPQEMIKKISLNHADFSGEKNPMYGQGHKISGSKNGMYGIRRHGSSNPMFGKGDKLKDEKNGMYGKKHKKETKEKMSLNHADFSGEKNGRAKGLTAVDIESNRSFKFGAMSEASKSLNISYKIIVTYSKNNKVYKNKYRFVREA